MWINSQSLYEEIIDKLTVEGRVRVFTDEENMQIVKDLAIPDEEIRAHRKNMIASAEELKDIFLD